MEKYSVNDINKFLITDDDTGLTYLGGNQEWYGKFFRRLAGCGPTAAANIFKYLGTDKLPPGSVRKTDTLRQYKTLMNEMWDHVTPTSHGVYCTEIFYDGCLSFAESKGFRIDYSFIDVPDIADVDKGKASRPALSAVIDFVKNGLAHDLPVAFLSLDSGSERSIDRWHWITVISLVIRDDEQASVDFLDAGIIKHADLAGWYRTTKEGGGFVIISPACDTI
ncbi:MAG: hypothetical protein LKJ83_05940 [Eubacteriaceae bacterium]|nr:hypothetical protein [Eubacteriaceae bacterium]